MKQRHFFTFILLFASVFCVQFAQAKVWRVNNNSGIVADFNTLTAAAAAAAPGDTLYVEGSATAYNLNQSKRLVMIGPGYFLSGSGGNAGLQANPNTAAVGITLDSMGSGSQYIGLTVNYLTAAGGADDLIVSRCNINSIGAVNSGTYANWKVSQCYIINLNMTYPARNWEITNNININAFALSTGQNCLVRNNMFANTGVNISNTYFSNNILLNASFTNVNSTVKYNLSDSGVLPAGNNNQNNIARNTLILQTGSTDGFYQLPTNSPAIGAGEPIGGITPDAGAFGTATPYRLSGIPPIPAIYSLTVPSSIPSNATSITVTLSTRSNN